MNNKGCLVEDPCFIINVSSMFCESNLIVLIDMVVDFLLLDIDKVVLKKGRCNTSTKPYQGSDC